MAVTIRPAMGLLHTEQRRAGEDFVLTWTLGQDFSILLGGSGAKGSEGTEIEGALSAGTEMAGALIEGTLMEGVGGLGSEMDRSSTLGR